MPFSTYRKIVLAIAVCASAASCSPIVNVRGHSDEQADYSQIVVGQSTKDDVQALLGTPSVKSNFGDETWYYINEKKETRGMMAPEVIEQHTTAVHFDSSGRVTDIGNADKKDSKPIEYVEKTTPTEGHKLTFMEQLLGNFGKFAAPGREIDPRQMR